MQIIVLAERTCTCGRKQVYLSHPVNDWRHADSNPACNKKGGK